MMPKHKSRFDREPEESIEDGDFINGMPAGGAYSDDEMESYDHRADMRGRFPPHNQLDRDDYDEEYDDEEEQEEEFDEYQPYQ